MKKVFVSAVITLLFVIVLTGMRLATFPRTEASGKFITTYTTVHSAMEDKFNTIIELSSMVTYTGTLEGTSVLQGALTVRRDGSANFQGVETFTGLVNGTPGTLTFKIDGSNDLYQAIELNNIITGGTGELASFQGELFKDGIIKDNGPIGTYMGRIDNQ